MDILNDIVSGIMVETAWGPPLYLEDPFAPVPAGTTTASDIFKPKITFYLRTGGQKTIAPSGDPGATKWPIVQAGLVVLAIGVGWLLLRGMRRRKA